MEKIFRAFGGHLTNAFSKSEPLSVTKRTLPLQDLERGYSQSPSQSQRPIIGTFGSEKRPQSDEHTLSERSKSEKDRGISRSISIRNDVEVSWST